MDLNGYMKMAILLTRVKVFVFHFDSYINMASNLYH